MQRNSTQHIIDRFKEKFHGTISFKDKEFFELTKDDYDNIHKMCKDDTIGYQLQMSPKEKGKAVSFIKRYLCGLYSQLLQRNQKLYSL